MNRAELIINQFLSYYGNTKDQALESILVSYLLTDITREIVNQNADSDQFKKIVNPDPNNPYIPIPNAQHYIQLFKNIFYKVDFGSDAEFHLQTSDISDDDGKDQSITLQLIITWPREPTGFTIGIGLLPNGNGTRFTTGLVNATEFRNRPDLHNKFFLPYIPKQILSFREYLSDLTKNIEAMMKFLVLMKLRY